MHSYLICGLHVSSELELPGAIPVDAHAGPIDVLIRRRVVSMTLDGATARGQTWEMVGENYLLRVPGLARFEITAGREIAIEIEPSVTERDAARLVLGPAFDILLHQRGALVLHGAAVASDGRAIAICGVSGAGKSTLAAALCRDGCSFAADDICVVGLNGRREPIVQSDGRQLKLWHESIAKLDLSERRGEAVRDTVEKYYIEPFDRVAEPPKLSAIYVLHESHPPMQVGIESLTLADAMRMLEYEADRPTLRDRMGTNPRMLALGAATLGHARIFLLVYPRGFEHLEETVETLRAHWDSLDGRKRPAKSSGSSRFRNPATPVSDFPC